jgi:hypothetical protein
VGSIPYEVIEYLNSQNSSFRAERIKEWELTLLEFQSSYETAVWPEEELHNIVCDVTCAIVTVLSN